MRGSRERRFLVRLRLPTLLLTFILLSTYLAPFAQPVAAVSSSGTTTISRGMRVVNNADGSRAVSFLPTFQKWDGTHQLVSSLDFASGNWPYSVQQDPTSLTIGRGGKSFVQGKVPGANYEFQPNAIKETMVIPDARRFPTGTIALSLASTYQVQVSGLTVQLLDASGGVAWETARFVAWDSSKVPRRFPTPVTALEYAGGVLTMVLDPTLLREATYPLYIDPTWVLRANTSNSWPGTLDHVTSDWGDSKLKIGNKADNFDGNTNRIWTVLGGTFTVSGGRATLSTMGTVINTSGSWADLRFGNTINFAQAGIVQEMFRYVDIWTHYYLEISSFSSCCPLVSPYVQLGKIVSSSPTIISPQVTVSISTGVDYEVKVVAIGNYFEVWWNGALQWSGTESPPPPPPPPPGTSPPASPSLAPTSAGGVGFEVRSTPGVIVLDNVRVWTATRTSGNYTSPIRDAGTNVPAQIQYLGAADGYNSDDLRIRSSWDNVTWGDWHVIKSMAAPGPSLQVPDVDQRRFYQVRAVLRTGNDQTPAIGEIDVTENPPQAAITAIANTGRQPWYFYVGGMVNAISGNLFLTSSDISIRAKGFPIAISRAYNSKLAALPGPFGLGTTHNFNANLAFPAGGNVTLNDGDGASYTFATLGGNSYSPPRGLHFNLIKNVDVTYTLWKPDGSRMNFDGTGKLTTIVDKNGNRLTLIYTGGKPTRIQDDSGLFLNIGYDASNRISNITDPMGRKVIYAYDTSNRPTQFRDPMGFTTNYSYDGTSGRLARIVDAAGGVTRFVYNANQAVIEVWRGEWNFGTNSIKWEVRAYSVNYVSGSRTDVTDAKGSVTQITFNSLGNPTQIVGPNVGGGGCASCGGGGNSTAYTWDGEFDRLTTTDGGGNTVANTYDWMGNVLTTKDPGGNTSLNTFSNIQIPGQFISLLTSVTNARGFATNYTYDAKSNLITTMDAGGNISTNFYNAAGSLVERRDFKGNSWKYGYDAHEFPVNSTDPGGNVTTYQNDLVGRTWNTTTPGGNVTRKVYDADDRVTVGTDGMGNSTSFEYNKRGDQTKVTDANGNAVQYLTNITLGKTAKVTDSGGNTTTYVYNNTGEVVKVTDANNHATTYQYDIYHRQTKTISPLGYATQSVYDAAGNRIRRIDANGNLTRFFYDRNNPLIQTIYPNGKTVNLTYDKNGNVITETGLGYTKTTSFDRLDRVTSIMLTYGPFSKTVTYTYDADGNRLSLKDGEGGTTAYAYDKSNRLVKLADPEGRVTTFSYDKDSRRVLETYPNGVKTLTNYDRANRITKLTTKNSTGTVLESFEYTYDKVGNRLTMKEANGNTTTYVYTKEYRLYKVTYPSTIVERFSYDAVGNRLTRTYAGTTTTHTYDDDDRLTSSSDGWAYTYDGNGNMRTKAKGGQRTTYEFDHENRLTKVTYPGGQTCTYTYTPTGQRITAGCSLVTYYGYDFQDGNGLERVVAEYDSTGTRQARYTLGPRVDQPVGVLRGGSYYSYHGDALGSITRMTDASQNAARSYAYDAWGSITSQTGTLTNPFTFTGREKDPASSLYYYRSRMYDPDAGRFTSKDRAGMCDGTNLYIYVRDNPVNRIDPSGRCPYLECYVLWYGWMVVRITASFIPSYYWDWSWPFLHETCDPGACVLRITWMFVPWGGWVLYEKPYYYRCQNYYYNPLAFRVDWCGSV